MPQPDRTDLLKPFIAQRILPLAGATGTMIPGGTACFGGGREVQTAPRRPGGKGRPRSRGLRVNQSFDYVLDSGAYEQTD